MDASGLHAAFAVIDLVGFSSEHERVQYGIAYAAPRSFAVHMAMLFAQL